jgi:hypothetical protein
MVVDGFGAGGAGAPNSGALMHPLASSRQSGSAALIELRFETTGVSSRND